MNTKYKIPDDKMNHSSDKKLLIDSQENEISSIYQKDSESKLINLVEKNKAKNVEHIEFSFQDAYKKSQKSL